VWKFWTNGEDAYVQSRMMGMSQKISLHQSGNCSWAMTQEWMSKPEAERFRGASRHMYTWKIDRCSKHPVIACRIHVPHEEMRTIIAPERSIQKVTWLTPPKAACFGALVTCYIPPPNEPRWLFSSPLETIKFLPMECGGGLLVGGAIFHETPDERAEINRRKAEIRETHLKMGTRDVPPQYRGVLVQTSEPFPTFTEITPSDLGREG
jgi:hypothetical protein